MPAHRIPTAVLKIRGSLDGSNKALLTKRREGEPTPRGDLGKPPKGMPPEIRARWYEIVKLSHIGTICDSDALIIEELSYLLHRCRENHFNVAPAILARYERCLACLGMTPADRSRVKVDKTKVKKDDPLDKFFPDQAAA